MHVQDTYDMDHELPNQIFALVSHLLELAGLIIIVSVLQPYFLVGAVHPAARISHKDMQPASCTADK